MTITRSTELMKKPTKKPLTPKQKELLDPKKAVERGNRMSKMEAESAKALKKSKKGFKCGGKVNKKK